MADRARNDAFDRALTSAISTFKRRHDGRAPRVLDIGSGSGLLAMMAARAGAIEVHTLEMCEHPLPKRLRAPNHARPVPPFCQPFFRPAPPTLPPPSPLMLLIPLLPLIAAVVAGLWRKQVGRAGAHWVTILGVAVSFLLSAWVLYQQVYGGLGTVNVSVEKGGLEIPTDNGKDAIVIANAGVIVKMDL